MCHSVQMGEVLCPRMHHRSHDQSGSLSRGVAVQGRFCPGGLCPGGVSIQGVSVWGLCMGVSVWVWFLSGSLCPGGGLCQGDGTIKSGRYASYWNVFLFILIKGQIARQLTNLSDYLIPDVLRSDTERENLGFMLKSWHFDITSPSNEPACDVNIIFLSFTRK